jgi:molecular chaperone GrpE
VTRRNRPDPAEPVEGPTLNIDDDLLAEALAAVEKRAAESSPRGDPEEDSEIPIEVDTDDLGGAGGEIMIEPLTDDLVVSLEAEADQLPPWLQVPEDLLEPVEPQPARQADHPPLDFDDELTDPRGFTPAPPPDPEPQARARSLLSDPQALQRVSKMRRRIKSLQRKVEELESKLDQERQSNHLSRSRARIAENGRVEAEEQRDNIDRFARSLRQRVLAQEEELARLQKRSSTDVERAKLFGADATIREILPVLDNLDLALAHADTDPEKFVPGVRMVASLFLRSLERVGVTTIEAAPGTPFDPSVHEAILTLPSDEHPEGTVAEEVRRGYSLHDRLLRASQVSVVGPPRKPRERSVPPAADDAAPSGRAEDEE